MRRATALASLAALLLTAAPAAASADEIAPPMRLPAVGATASSQAPDWLLGVRPGTPLPPGARRVQPGTILVGRDRARALAARLERRGVLTYAEPDRPVDRASVADANMGGWARGAVVDPGVSWPTDPRAIAVIDDFVDSSVPDLQGQVSYLNATATSQVEGPHGTEVASAAAAAYQGTGVAGVLPGAPIASWGVPVEATCSDITRGIDAARVARVAVVNISMGSRGACFSQYLAAQKAYGAGVLVVASAGNDYQDGNPVIYPAAFPHVISVAAVDEQLRSAPFSSANAAVDVSAPGVNVPLAIPPAFDTEDGTQDGFTLAHGTSFSAPMVAGAAAWLKAARPGLSVGQIADVLRFSAADLAAQGYDNDTGWGLVDVGRALQHPAPAEDPLEPNDGIAFVNGSVFSKPDAFRWKGTGAARLSAFADQVEDPLDVYRFRLRPRSRARITLKPRFGDADLAIFDQTAKTTSDRRGLVCASRRGLRKTDSCTVVWRGRGARVGYVAIAVADSSEGLASGYTLRFRRLR